MKIFKKIVSIILIVIIIGAIGISAFIGREVFNGYTNSTSREETIENEEKYNLYEFNRFVEKYESEEFPIPSSFESHSIPAVYIKKDGNDNIALFVHGMGGTKKSLTNEMEFFLENGFNVIGIDQRNSGDNLAEYNTFGYLESYDISDAINHIKNKINNKGKLLLYGESYGGISSIIAAGRDDSNVDYLVLDSPVSNGEEMLWDILKGIEKDQGVPASFMKFTGNIYTKFKLGFTFDDINGNEWIKEVSIPILILNSKVDTITPYKMGEDLYNNINHNDKNLATSEIASHAKILQEDKDVYVEAMKAFLSKY